MNHITFPKREWEDVKRRLEQRKIVSTIRVSDEYGKYHVGDVVNTEWGTRVKILTVKKIAGGIDELARRYEHFDELTEEMLGELRGYNEMEMITLSTV